MIKGIGTDILELRRIEKAILKDKFIEKYFTDNEIKLFRARNGSCLTIASNFAVKESVSKVLGTGFRAFGLKDIEVLRDSLGKPYVNLYNMAKKLQEELGIDKFHVSITHSKENIVAFVIGEGD